MLKSYVNLLLILDRGSLKQIRQLAGMRGLMANPKGEIIERPIKANFMEGLSVLEYFISTHGARKGLADTALRTADSGYLTRRLVDVAQDVVIREEDCGTLASIELPLRKEDRLNDHLLGRLFGDDIVHPNTGEVLYRRNDHITKKVLERLDTVFADERFADMTVKVRSVLVCESEYGICQRCYGRSLATNELVAIGEAVGHVAAQSIGEPGTQLTMRTFHLGGVAGLDITQGLPRVVELFEARTPKGQAKLIEAEGIVRVEEGDKFVKVHVVSPEGEIVQTCSVNRRQRLLVKDGQQVEPGDLLNEGAVNPKELLEVLRKAYRDKYASAPETPPFAGMLRVCQYIVDEVQKVYKSQGVDIDDKHIELIVRQMTKKVVVNDPGDTTLLPGEMIDRTAFLRENQVVEAAGGEPATADEVILGITKASLATDSFLSAASFQETTKVLTDAALEGKTDYLRGLKENVIIGKLIPAATGLKVYRNLEVYSTRQRARAFELEGGPGQYGGGPLTPEEEWARLVGGGRRDEDDIPIDDLDLPTYIHSVLSRVGIETVGELAARTPGELLAVPGFGQKSLEEVRARLRERGVSLRDDAMSALRGMAEPEGMMESENTSGQ